MQPSSLVQSGSTAVAGADGAGCADAIGAVEAGLIGLVRGANDPRAHGRLERRAGVTLDRSSYVLLSRISEQGRVRISDLASAVGVDLSTASRQAARLVAWGLVDRNHDPADRRVAVLSLRPQGRKLLTRMRAARRAWITDMLDGWSDRDQATLARLLDRLITSMADVAEAEPDLPTLRPSTTSRGRTASA